MYSLWMFSDLEIFFIKNSFWGDNLGRRLRGVIDITIANLYE